MLKLLQVLLLVIIMQPVSGQGSGGQKLRLLFLNADRLYDTTDNEGTADDDYTPEGSMKWDGRKYEKRCEDIAGILSSLNSEDIPGIIALSGIENESIAKDILSSRKLRKPGYSILASSFYPGSGIVLASSGGSTELLEKKIIIPDLNPGLSEISVMLYCKVKTGDGATYHFFLNEWPDRINGGNQSSSTRMACAAALRKEIDLILNFEREARIIIMGSFYDEPTDGSIMNLLNATNKRKNLSYRDLYNLYYDRHNMEDQGTIMVNGIWQMSDFIIVSPSLLKEGEYFSVNYDGGRIGEPSSTFGPTYLGNEYTGGSGAHLPVFIDLGLKGNR